jgi:phage terminase large subunit-like protein
MKLSPIKHPFCTKGHKYAEEVVSGKITACVYVIGACKRYLRDIDNTDALFWMDWDAAERYLRLVQKFEHVIGKWPTKNIVYEPWQCWIWMNIMGFKDKLSGNRRFRVAHVEVARGNAKSAMASQLALFILALDSPNGNQISTVATKKDQARIVLDSSRAMARKNSSFMRQTGVRVLAHSIVHTKTNSVMRALSSDSGSLDGLNDVLAICDELHAMSRDVFDVITSGMSKRKDSLTLCITTAGRDVHSVGYSQSVYAKRVAIGDTDDDQLFAVIYTLDDEDKSKKIPADRWDDEKVWIKANPGLGVSVDIDTLRAKVEKAKITPADIPNIKIKHMDQWIAEAKAYFDQNAWDKCADPTLNIEDFRGKEARLGLDLASHIDIASFAAVFYDKGIYYIFDKSYLPEATVESARNTLYTDCVAKGFLIATKGEAINYEFIQGEMLEMAKNIRVKECLYDAWNATETAQKLSGKIEMVKVGMNTANFSEPMKKLDGAIRKGLVRHNGSPLLRWCLGNVVAKEDHNSNVFPRKSHEKLKIDPIVAILMAMAGWVADSSEPSIYETTGIRTI